MNKHIEYIFINKIIVGILVFTSVYVSGSEFFGYLGFGTNEIGSYLLFLVLLGLFIYKKNDITIGFISGSLALLSVFLCVLNMSTTLIYILFPIIYILLNKSYLSDESSQINIENSGSIILFVAVIILISMMIVMGSEIINLRASMLFDPNFFAGAFILLFIPFVYGSGSVRVISLFLIILVTIISLSRAFLVALIFTFVIRFLIWSYWRSYYRILGPILIIITVLLPFLYFSADNSAPTEYSVDASRLYSLTDKSVSGRNDEIRYAANHIIETEHYFVSDEKSAQELRKPHNWFWSLAVTYGLITALVVLLSFFYIAQKLSLQMSFVICIYLIFSSFLDHISLWPALYLIIIITVFGGLSNSKVNLNLS